MFCCLVDPAEPPNADALEAVANACSPRVMRCNRRTVIFDACGLRHILGSSAVIVNEVAQLAGRHGVAPNVVIAVTMTTAWILAASGVSGVVVRGAEQAKALNALRLHVLSCLGPEAWGLGPVPPVFGSLSRWGLHTLGDLARLPEAEVRTRLGELGARLHQAARGLDAGPLVPQVEPAAFRERIELEWPIEGLEPLSFVLSRLCESLSVALERADRGAVTITTRLRLVTRQTHERVLHLPAPMRDAKVLRTLILLDLESHAPSAAIDVVELDFGVTPGRIVQGSLLTRALPSDEQLSTLLARLGALMGETRVGAPMLPDAHDERVVKMKAFAPAEAGKRPGGRAGECLPAHPLDCLPASLQRYRRPIPIGMTIERGRPMAVRSHSRAVAGGRVLASGGPWRTSGRWWAFDASRWDRDDWDIELPDGVYRAARDRTTGQWEIEGALD